MRRKTRYAILDDLDEQERVELHPSSLQTPPTGGVDVADPQLESPAR